MAKITDSPEETEKIIEKYRFWQIIFGGVIGFAMGFLPMLVAYVDNTYINPPILPIQCEGEINITYPKTKAVVYGDEVDIAGTVEPSTGCRNIFLVVGALSGHTYFVTDFVTVNPDGTWDATAKLQIVPYGTKARIQARLCGEHDAYPPEGCLSEVPNRGVASNSIVISREAGLPLNKNITRSNSIDLTILEYSSIASGLVTGLKDNYKKYKIVIYAQDTKFGWIKQPYPSDQKGFGWAAILPNGSWSIQLKNRPSQRMFTKEQRVLLMDINEKAPNRVLKLQTLNFITSKVVPNDIL